MKSKNFRQVFFKPFTRVAGWPALGIGLAAVILTSLIAQRNHIVFDTVLGAHFIYATPWQSIAIHLISWLCLVICMWGAGKIFSKSSIRLIDISGTMAFARIPLILAAFAGFLPSLSTGIEALVSFNYSFSKIWSLVVFLIITIFAIIWFVALAYNGFKVSCNLKGTKCTIIFTVSLILSQILSTVLNLAVMKKLLLIAAFTGGLNASAPTDSTQTQSRDYSKVNSIAIETVNALNNEDYDKATAHFDAKMQEVFPKKKVKAFMEQLEGQLGKMSDVKDKEIRNAYVDGYEIVYVPCKFEKREITLQFSFDKSGEICGMFVR